MKEVQEEIRILVVSPHPDDEALGAGGTILRFKKMGYKVYWLNITDIQGIKEYEPFIKQIMTMEIMSETNFGKPQSPFQPNYYIDISRYFEKKLEALKIYDTELGEYPFPRSLEAIEAQAKIRGVESGVCYAEAFRLLKMIV